MSFRARVATHARERNGYVKNMDKNAEVTMNIMSFMCVFDGIPYVESEY